MQHFLAQILASFMGQIEKSPLAQDLFSDTPAGVVINTLIYALFLFGLASIASHTLVLRREQGRIRAVRKALAVPHSTSPDGSRSPASRVSTLSELWERTGLKGILEGVDPSDDQNTVIGRCVRALWDRRGALGGAAEAISTLEDERQALPLELPRYLTSILVLLGLGGTVWGLRDIISQLNQSLGGTDPASLVRALGPMQSAFSCTLAGIVTSIVLAFLLNRLDDAQGKLAADTEDLLTCQVAPLLFPPTGMDAADKMAAVLLDSRHYLQEFGETITQSRTFFSETLSGALTEAAVNLQTTLAGATAALGGSLDGMKSTAAALTESARSIVTYRDELASERQRIQAYLVESLGRIEALSTGVLQPLKTAAEEMTASRTVMETLARESQQGRQESLDQFDTTVGHLQTIAQDMIGERDALTAVAAEMQRANQTLARQTLDANQALSQQVLEAIQAISEQFMLRLRENADESRRSSEVLDDLVRQVNPEMLTLPNGQIMGNALADVTQQLGTLPGKFDALSASLNAVSGGLDSSSERLDSRLETVTCQVAATGDQIQALVPLVTRAAEKDGRQQMAEILEINRQSLAAVEKMMQDNLLELRRMRSYMQEPLWKHMVGVRDGKNNV